jgi:hypothetical protein
MFRLLNCALLLLCWSRHACGKFASSDLEAHSRPESTKGKDNHSGNKRRRHERTHGKKSHSRGGRPAKQQRQRKGKGQIMSYARTTIQNLRFVNEESTFKVQLNKSLCLMPRQCGWWGDRRKCEIILGRCSTHIPEINWQQIDGWGRIWSNAGGCMLPRLSRNKYSWETKYYDGGSGSNRGSCGPVYELGEEIEWVYKDGENPCHHQQWTPMLADALVRGPCDHWSWGESGLLRYCGDRTLGVSSVEDGARVKIVPISFTRNNCPEPSSDWKNKTTVWLSHAERWEHP